HILTQWRSGSVEEWFSGGVVQWRSGSVQEQFSTGAVQYRSSSVQDPRADAGGQSVDLFFDFLAHTLVEIHHQVSDLRIRREGLPHDVRFALGNNAVDSAEHTGDI